MAGGLRPEKDALSITVPQRRDHWYPGGREAGRGGRGFIGVSMAMSRHRAGQCGW